MRCAQLAQQPFGRVLVWVVSIGMFLLVIWQLLEAAFGHRDEEGKKRAFKRLSSAGKAILYAVVGVSGVKVAMGARPRRRAEQRGHLHRDPDGRPGRQLLVGLVALAIIGYGVYQIYRAYTEKFIEKLDGEGRSGDTGRAYKIFGKVGYTARGIAICIIGGLFGYAAITHDAKKSGGLDQALFEVLDKPFGPVLLGLLGVGLACYGLFTLRPRAAPVAVSDAATSVDVDVGRLSCWASGSAGSTPPASSRRPASTSSGWSASWSAVSAPSGGVRRPSC